MRRLFSISLIAIFNLAIIFQLFPTVVQMNVKKTARILASKPVQQSSTFKILGPDKRSNPVVNEGRLIELSAVDNSNQPIASGISWESDSPDIATVDPNTGVVTGKRRGFTTITARRGSESSSAFVVIVRVSKSGAKVINNLASSTMDTGNQIYISDPINSVIRKKDGPAGPDTIFAGKEGVNSRKDGNRKDALFAGPTAIAVDNRVDGGIFIADTLNHSIRKISFNEQVTTILGSGSPGITSNDVTKVTQAADVQFRSPIGLATDGNLFIADTDNHAIYVFDIQKSELRLLAGQPGTPGKADGKGRAARFNRPAGIAISPDKKFLAVAEIGNNLVRTISIVDGTVSTIVNDRSIDFINNHSIGADALGDIPFDAPQSISFDSLFNLYVVDRNGVSVVLSANQKNSQILPLAQTGSFVQPSSIIVNGNAVVVLDSKAATPDEALSVVTVGAPEITSLSQDRDSLEGGSDILITGKNFAPESQIILGDTVVTNAIVESSTRIRLKVPPQKAPGDRTLSIRTRGGIAQQRFTILSKSVQDLANGDITTIAGGVLFIGDSGLATNAQINNPTGIALDPDGNLFITDLGNNRIRRVDTTNQITTIAGNGVRGTSGDNISGLSASLLDPFSVATDGAGNIFIAEFNGNRIRRIDARTGIITTLAGSLSFSLDLGDNGPAISAHLSGPTGVAVDKDGNTYISDSFFQRIRKVDAKTGIITSIAGNGVASFSGDNGPAKSATINFPRGLQVDNAGNIYVADTGNDRIRKIDAVSGNITTVAGNGKRDFNGDNGLATAASLNFPTSVAIDNQGNIFITDTGNNRIRRVDAQTGVITTVVGNGTFGFGGDNGQAINASLAFPGSVILDGAGNILISDTVNGRVRIVNNAGIINTIAGSDVTIGDNGSAIKASLNNPYSIVLDSNGSMFIADANNNRIRKIDGATGIISTIAGSGLLGFNGDGGPAKAARLSTPLGVALDSNGNVIISDSFNNRVRLVDSSGNIKTIAGNGTLTFSGDGGPAINAGLNLIGISFGIGGGVATDSSGNIYVADSNNNRIRKIDSNGIITTVAGGSGSGFSGDNGPATKAGLFMPFSISLDEAGNLFIADTLNSRIRKVNLKTGIITTVAGNGAPGFSGDGGPATAASLNGAFGAVVDKVGNIFIPDPFNNRVRRVDGKTGIITTVAGSGSSGFGFTGSYGGDGGSAIKASLNSPLGLAIDADGNLLIADTFNNAIRIVKGVANGQSPVVPVAITSASYTKPNLVINGNGFGTAGAIVTVNGQNISSLIAAQTDTSITIKGKQKKLSLKSGANQIVVKVGDAISNTFILNLLVE